MDKGLKQFWDQEGVVSSGMFSKEEKECEAHYQPITKPLVDERFKVHLRPIQMQA